MTLALSRNRRSDRIGTGDCPSVADGGTGLRFNFPGMSPFRGISWAERFVHSAVTT